MKEPGLFERLGLTDLIAIFLIAAVALALTLRAEGDTLTEVDKLRLENANLFAAVKALAEEADTCRGQLAQPRAIANEKQFQERRTQAKAEIEKAHPGFTLDLATGTLTPKPVEKLGP